MTGTDNRLAPTLVRASAGTGKTYQLTARLLRILLQGSPPESILATTFTRKVAGEIVSRVLILLAKAADREDPNSLEALRQQLELPGLSRKTCLTVFDDVLRNIHRLRICTLDSFFSQLARSFAFELGLPPAWRLCDEIEETWFRDAAVDAVISTAGHREMVSLIAMLGKGEIRRSVTEDLVRVINESYGSSRQCGAEVWDQLAVSTLPSDRRLAQAADEFRAASPRQKRLAAAITKLADVLEKREFDSLVDDTLVANIAKARRTRTPVKYYSSTFDPKLDEAFDTLYAAVRCKSLSLLRAQNKATGTVLISYDKHVHEIKQAARAFGFDDITQLLASRLRDSDFQDLDRRMDARLEHLLLDEFQDTAPHQWQVLKPFARRAAGAATGRDDKVMPRSFFCVGDSKQAIYGWRGGVAEILDAAVDQLPGVTELPLHKSWRSSPIVIDFINQVFKHIHQHPIYSRADSSDPCDASGQGGAALRRFATGCPNHETARADLAGYVCFETAARMEDAAIDPTFQTASRIADRIHRAAPEKEIGILTRTNAGVGKAIYALEQRLAGRNVDISQEGGDPLTDSAAVELVLSALMMSEHPGDGRWEYHVAGSPLAKLPEFGDEKIRTSLTDQGLAETVEYLAGALAPVCNQRDTVRLKQLVRLAIAYERNATPRVRDFVAMVQVKRVERPQTAKIRVMTVHKAKGLEFDAVILPELEGKLGQIGGRCIPQIEQVGDPPIALSRHVAEKQRHFLPRDWQRAFAEAVEAAMTESICLLYVAITRARQAVHLVIRPTGKKEFKNKSSAALIFYALGQPGDPTKPDTILYESGTRQWHK